MKQGRVVINRNICDNAPECSGIEVCPTGALYWDEEAESIAYDQKKCCDCGSCADPDAGGCPVGAILWGKDDDDYQQKIKIVEDETMTLEQLEVDRYGAAPMSPVADYDQIKDRLLDPNAGYFLIEFFNDNSINCLVHSIKIEELFELFGTEVQYSKVEIDDISDYSSEYGLEELPALAIFRSGQFLGIVNGYYENSEEERSLFFSRIKDILARTDKE